MHITKKQSIAGAGLVLIVAIAALLFAARTPQRHDTRQPSSAVEGPPVSEISTPSAPGQIVLDNFHRTETRNGEAVWEVKAVKGTLDPSTSVALLEEAEVTLSRKKDEPTYIESDHAKVLIQGATLKSAEAWGNVIVKQRDMELHSDRALYDLQAQQVEVPGAVEIKNSLLHITGSDLQGNLESQVFHLQRDVETTISNDGKK